MSVLSDHNMINITVNWKPLEQKQVILPTDRSGFSGLDFRRANFELLNERISEVDWTNLFNRCTLDELPIMVHQPVEHGDQYSDELLI